MRWCVTGSSGFLGGAVVRALEGDTGVTSLVRVVRSAREADLSTVRAIDLARIGPEALARLWRDDAPDVVIHCAGRTPPASTDQFWLSNTRATAVLLEAARRSGRRMRVVLVGSAAELGPVPASFLPVDESCPCRPRDAYGLSTWAATRLGVAGWWGGLVEVVVGRVFNLIGAGMSSSQVFGRFARTLACAEREPVELAVSDLEARRDFVDVRDVADALIALARSGRSGSVYHIGTGHSRAIAEGLGTLIRVSGRAVRVCAAARVPTGAMESVASIEKISSEVGWVPRIGFEESLVGLWEDALERAGGGSRSRWVA